MAVDRHGNEIDPIAGFARGKIISSATEEGLRLKEGQRVAAERVRRLGPESIGIFTGNQRDYPVFAEDLTTLCEEWIGPGLFAEDLHAAAIAHVGGQAADEVSVFNRTSAAIVATVLALSGGRPVVAISPEHGKAHASVARGAQLAAVPVHSVEIGDGWEAMLVEHRPKLVILTTVTSSLERMPEEAIARVATAARRRGATVFLDEAYGARLRTALYAGAPSLSFDADLVVTNCDKAGLSGPRAGLMVGRADLVAQISARGSGLGMEARAPIGAGALRSLQGYRPEILREEAREGQELASALAERLGHDVVAMSDLGPMIHEDAMLTLLQRKAGIPSTTIVPAEATSALGMLLLRDHGILTVNTHGQPGARVSVRLKPTSSAIHRVGGVDAVIDAMSVSIDALAAILHDPEQVARLVLGGRA